ncbi:3-phytase precursor [Gimesia panareensis]|uniref:3-phytase n=2 Tax=Gimesia panareensis TaxID=2527978 RepID=A0A518FLZ0_9PLAN|nr:3-phytase precursor [Gimesia panareensis]
MFFRYFLILSTCLLNQPLATLSAGDPAATVPLVEPEFVCKALTGKDQDDMCVWVHPEDPALSVIVTADKAAGQLFVYDLTGRQLHSVKAEKPGNIDLRAEFPLGGEQVPLVVCNQREGELKLLAFCLDPQTRNLVRVDNGQILTKSNYGGTLYHSSKTGKFYFFSTTKDDGVEQFELFDDGTGKVAGKKVRQWPVGQSEGAVADDEAGVVYIGEEEGGVWKVAAEPDRSDKRELIIKIGEHGLKGDVEGLALYSPPEGKSYLILSDQGRSRFMVFDRGADYRYVGAFAVKGATDTDGIEALPVKLGAEFPKGLFACHTDRGSRNTIVVSWKKIAEALQLP